MTTSGSAGTAGAGAEEWAAAAPGHGAARSYLIVRRAGSVWGVADAVVEGRTGEGGFCIRAGGEALAADEILAVVERLRVLPLGASLARWWPEVAAGLAVHGGRPLVVIDPLRPPRALLRPDRRGESGESPGGRPAEAKAKGKPRKAGKGRSEK